MATKELEGKNDKLYDTIILILVIGLVVSMLIASIGSLFTDDCEARIIGDCKVIEIVEKHGIDCNYTVKTTKGLFFINPEIVNNICVDSTYVFKICKSEIVNINNK
jgi:hypothetical protein